MRDISSLLLHVGPAITGGLAETAESEIPELKVDRRPTDDTTGDTSQI